MPRFLGRLLWAMRGKRRVSVHLTRPIEDGGSLTIEGVLIGRWAGQHVLELAALLRPEADGTANKVTLDARYIEIPNERVLFCEVFSN